MCSLVIPVSVARARFDMVCADGRRITDFSISIFFFVLFSVLSSVLWPPNVTRKQMKNAMQQAGCVCMCPVYVSVRVLFEFLFADVYTGSSKLYGSYYLKLQRTMG